MLTWIPHLVLFPTKLEIVLRDSRPLFILDFRLVIDIESADPLPVSLFMDPASFFWSSSSLVEGDRDLDLSLEGPA